ncbi:hypothetical protein [Microbacterium rhizosphaerae]|uniref:Serine/arginine repetitive matrix protein 2 n=1 Tax=Microbacterium rhizosphaerae TaxID=1678237 RepID=A0ABZ0SS92_9MICO|nr:hypothetical protein [Microbacterium rhizosphaerae]WPR91305.1 hypothetical protein SM116_08510 [Microbacterium rhizosphaerae]
MADGESSWRSDAEVAELMSYAARRYAALARKHGLDPWEAATAAFDAMRAASTRHADDPWAIVTRAVQVTCIAEERARGLMCSVQQARRPRYSAFHDAERFSDRENALVDYHPALRVLPPDQEECAGARAVESAMEDAIALFALVGWPADTARAGVEYVCARLADVASRISAFEQLRRDYTARVLLDVPQSSWRAMLRALLGCPDPAQEHTSAGRGILLRLLVGESLETLLHDDRLLTGLLENVPCRRS